MKQIVYNKTYQVKMKKSNSIVRHHNNNQNINIGSADSRQKVATKNKTMSTIVHTQNQQQQQTTKKNSLNKVSSCVKIAHSSCKQSKTNLKIEQKNNRPSSNIKNFGASAQENVLKQNEQLLSQNKILREEYCKLQESHLKDKAKIQLLIGRMSHIKSEQKTEKTSRDNEKSVDESECTNKGCLQKKKTLEFQLHKERIKVFELENEKKKWDKSREQLKVQYSQLLHQIQYLKERA